MNFRPLKRAPLLITAVILGCVCLLRWIQPDFLQRVENATYDLRVKASTAAQPPVATNLAFVWFDDTTIRAVLSGELGYNFGLYWPRQVYGRLVAELAAQGARAIAFDVVFGELRPDLDPVLMADGGQIGSDDFFALQMRRASNVVLAFTPEVDVPDLFATNAIALGDISTDKDSDGVLRRVRAFRDVPRWHPVLRQLTADPDNNLDLRDALVLADKLVLRNRDGEEREFALDAAGQFDLRDFVEGELPAGMEPRAKPFTSVRRWHMGIVLAAMELGLNLERAAVDLPAGRIVLRGAEGVERVLPVDCEGYFTVDWSMTPSHPALTCRPMHLLLAQNYERLKTGEGPGPESSDLRGKLVIVGSAVAGGNDLTDRGATPLQSDSLLVSKHWNVASSVLTGRFVQVLSAGQEMLLILGLGVVVALLTLRLPVRKAVGMVSLAWALFIGAAFVAHVHSRVWLPMVMPSLGMFLVHGGLLSWRVVFEQAERRRVRSVFAKIVSPNVVNELLNAEKLSLGGARRAVTVFFADVRGFTELTDLSQRRTEEFVAKHNLTGKAAEDYHDEQARETLATINLYLGVVADVVKRHDGTLDKYIGDCVMAFWGAPTANPRHALSCVRAAIDAQRAIFELNQRRAGANAELEAANRGVADGRELEPLLPLLELGTGVNTGVATVGLMGSDAHIVNYTVFGREVNLASRLEAVSGRGRIIISQGTFSHLLRDDPELAARCVKLPPVEVKGIRSAVEIYEVPWRNDR